MKPRLQFLRPLIRERGRHDDQHTGRRTATEDFGNDEARLNRLAKADVIGDEHAPRAVQEREGRLELVREDGDVGINDAGECPHAIRAPDDRGQPRDRLLRPHALQPIRSIDRAGPIERRQEREPGVTVRDVETDDVTIAADPLDAPALLSNPDEISG